MKKFKLNFKDLIGHTYTVEEKMIILDWMLKTGKQYTTRTGKWNVAGVSQQIFAYSANEYAYKALIPTGFGEIEWFFDAVFARAVFERPNAAVAAWRRHENVSPKTYRMLSARMEYPKNYIEPHRGNIHFVFDSIHKLNGRLLKKEFAHPERKDRKAPKIIKVEIYTLGDGWIVEYMFSFKNFNYEPGWTFSYKQEKGQSIWEFFGKTYNSITRKIQKQVL